MRRRLQRSPCHVLRTPCLETYHGARTRLEDPTYQPELCNRLPGTSDPGA